MVNYRRVYVEGGTYFFTVTLKNLKLDYLTTYVNELRESFSHVKKQQPFEIIAIVVLPEHFHCLWQLPEGDKNYAGRWRASSPYETKCNTGFDGTVPRISLCCIRATKSV